jgi:transporter family protein
MNWILWSLLAALFAAATALLAKAGVAGVNPTLANAVRTTFVLGLAWSAAFVSGTAAGVLELNRRAWWLLGCSGLATGLSWLCYVRALQLGPVSRVAPLDKLSVVLAVVGGAVFFGEVVTLRTVAGVSLIAGGAILLAGG